MTANGIIQVTVTLRDYCVNSKSPECINMISFKVLVTCVVITAFVAGNCSYLCAGINDEFSKDLVLSFYLNSLPDNRRNF